MKIFRLLISFLVLITVSVAADDSSSKQPVEDSPFMEFLSAVLTIYVREKFLEDNDVLEYAAEIEEALVNAGVDYNKIT